MTEDQSLLIAQLTYEYTTLAQTRLVLRHTISHMLSETLVDADNQRVLRTWPHVCTARHVWTHWRHFLLRRRGRVASFSRRRLHTDDTPILPSLN